MPAFAPYQQLLKDLEGDQEDVYAKIMKREQAALDTIGAVARLERAQELERRSFLTRSLLENAAEFARAWREVLTEELPAANSVSEVVASLTRGERPLFFGLGLLLVGALLLMLW